MRNKGAPYLTAALEQKTKKIKNHRTRDIEYILVQRSIEFIASVTREESQSFGI